MDQEETVWFKYKLSQISWKAFIRLCLEGIASPKQRILSVMPPLGKLS